MTKKYVIPINQFLYLNESHTHIMTIVLLTTLNVMNSAKRKDQQ